MKASCHPPKLLIRKSAIRARSGTSTLKDQQLGRVTRGRENTHLRTCVTPHTPAECRDIQQGDEKSREFCSFATTLVRKKAALSTLRSLLINQEAPCIHIYDVIRLPCGLIDPMPKPPVSFEPTTPIGGSSN